MITSCADHHDLSVVCQVQAYQIVAQQKSGPLSVGVRAHPSHPPTLPYGPAWQIKAKTFTYPLHTALLKRLKAQKMFWPGINLYIALMHQDSAKISSFGWNPDCFLILKVGKKMPPFETLPSEKDYQIECGYDLWRHSRIPILSAVINNLHNENAWCLCCFRVNNSPNRKEGIRYLFMEQTIGRKYKQEKIGLTLFNWS